MNILPFAVSLLRRSIDISVSRRTLTALSVYRD